MKSPAELFVESLTKWPEPMPSHNMTSDDWLDVVNLYSNATIEYIDGDVGLALIQTIESQGLTIDNFQGNEALFVFAFNALAKTYDLDRIQKFHKIHGQSIVDWINNKPGKDECLKEVEFFENIFTPKEA